MCRLPAAAAPAILPAALEQGLALFRRDVAKLLTEHCVKCHGGEKGVKGGFDLSTRETALKAGDSGLGVPLASRRCACHPPRRL